MEHASEDGSVSTARWSSPACSTCAAPPTSARPVYASSPAAPATSIVDISRVDSVDMTTLKMLAVANRVAERQGRRVVLRGASPGVRRLLHLSHMRWMIPVEPYDVVVAPPRNHLRHAPRCDPSRRVSDPTSLTHR